MVVIKLGKYYIVEFTQFDRKNNLVLTEKEFFTAKGHKRKKMAGIDKGREF